MSAATQATPSASPKPARPRDAASLVLVDESGPEPKVLMGKRHTKSSFVPDAFAFPGGKLDADDRLVTPATPLSPALTAKLAAIGQDKAHMEALALAAVRETWEEVGLWLTAPGDVGSDAGPAWTPFRERGHAPHLGPLDLIARAITPTVSPIRFHARFFVAEAHAAKGEIRSNGELSDLDWYPISEALKLPMIDVTEFVLEEVRRADWRHGLPALYCYRGDKPIVRRPKRTS